LNWDAYPGGDILDPGLDAYAKGEVSDGSLLVSIVLPRLRIHGWALEPRAPALESPHEKLYARLAERVGDGAHSAYNALIRRATSFCAAVDRLER
jgi:hypothetical protein